MQVEVEEVGPCRKRLSIELPADTVSSTYKTVVSEYAKVVQIQGFRTGRAPPRIVRAKFSKQIAKEVRDRLVPQGYQDALKQENLQPVAVLELDEVDVRDGQSFRYSVMCDIPPEFVLPDYKSVKLQGQPLVVPPEAIEEAIDHLRERHATYADIERPIEEEDLVQVNYTATVGGVALDEVTKTATGLGEAVEFWVLVEEKAFLPGFGEGLRGKEVGDRVIIQVSFPEDFAQEPLRGLVADYQVDVLKVRCKELPELDAAMLSTLNVESEESLRNQIEQELGRHYAQTEQRRLKAEIVKVLLAETSLDVPESDVKDETQSSIYQMVRDITDRGATEVDVKENKEKIFETAGKTAADKVKIRYILERISEEEQITIDSEEFQKQIGQMAAQQGVEQTQLLEYLHEQKLVENLRRDMRTEKTLDFLLEHADISV